MSTFSILYDQVSERNDIPMGARILFSKLHSLAQKKGYCWASNKYLANLYEVSEASIKRWLSDLKRVGFLSIETFKKGMFWERKIQIKIISPKGHPRADRRVTDEHIISQGLKEQFSFSKEKLKEKETAEPSVPTKPEDPPVRDFSFLPSAEKKEDREVIPLESPKPASPINAPEYHPKPKRDFSYASPNKYASMSQEEKDEHVIAMCKNPEQAFHPAFEFDLNKIIKDEDLLRELDLPDKFLYATVEALESEDVIYPSEDTVKLTRKLLDQGYGFANIRTALKILEKEMPIVRNGSVLCVAVGVMKNLVRMARNPKHWFESKNCQSKGKK